jgi:hypothetical protein
MIVKEEVLETQYHLAMRASDERTRATHLPIYWPYTLVWKIISKTVLHWIDKSISSLLEVSTSKPGEFDELMESWS